MSTKSKKVVQKVSANLAHLFLGDEPVFDDPNVNWTLIQALNWYANQKDAKDSKKYTIDYAKKHKMEKSTIEKLSMAIEDEFKNLGFVCRIMMRGAKIDKEEFINNRIAEIIARVSVVDNVQLGPEKTIQDRIFDQATTYINDIEVEIDKFIKTRTIDFICYDWLSYFSIKPIYTKQIVDHYRPLLEELRSALAKEDEQLVEAYSHYTRKELTQFHQFITDIINDCENFGKNVKTVRKTRKKKLISPDKKAAKLKFKKEDIESKTVSINATEIIAASQLWVYNTAYRKLGVYYAKDESGFNIRGTTLENFDEMTSQQKIIRKPLEILPLVTKMKKPDLKKFLSTINTKEQVLTGRINADVILLRVVK